jgi:hypothetical protein
MAILSTGVVLTIVFCILLVFRGTGPNVSHDTPQVAKATTVGDEANGSEDSGATARPHPSSVMSPPSATVARLVRAFDCHWAIGSHSPRTGDDLEPGRRLVLNSGLAEILFQNGVRAVLQGPAALEVSSKSSTLLERGRLTVAVIDPDARGFAVYASGMKYTDLGTEFGVYVAKDGSQEMHVFRGKVQAEMAANLPAPSGRLPSGASPSNPKSERSDPPHFVPLPSPLVLSANQAIRVTNPSKPFEPIAADEKPFFRAWPEPVPFDLFNTGKGLDRGATDPHWEIVGMSNDLNFTPRPATVTQPFSFYCRDNREKFLWLSDTRTPHDVPGGALWTFRTHFDLTGFDPATASIQGRLLVDDYISEMRLNGKKLPVPKGSHGPMRYMTWLGMSIDTGFGPGDNTFEIVIENSNTRTKDINSIALMVDWHGTARPWPGSQKK